MSVIVITCGGDDITDRVIVEGATFTSQANGTPGTCQFRVRDNDRTSNFTVGAEIVLTIDGARHWGGYVMGVARSYFFAVDDVDCLDLIPRGLTIQGVDYNILLQRRVLHAKTVGHEADAVLPEFPVGTMDSVILTSYITDYSDLLDDGITLSLGTYDSPAKDDPFSASASWTINDLLAMVGRAINAVWYITPDKVLVYIDESNTPVGVLTDTDNTVPFGLGLRHYREVEAVSEGSRLRNDALIWGAGGGSSSMVFSRSQDATSITSHGRWQVGQFNSGVWKQTTADRISNSYVYGSAQNHRGGKDNQTSVKLVAWDTVFRVAQIWKFYSWTFAGEMDSIHDDNFPIRQIEITFPTPSDAKFGLVLSHEIDLPFSMTDPVLLPGFELPPVPDIDIPMPVFPPFECLQFTFPIDVAVRMRVLTPVGETNNVYVWVSNGSTVATGGTGSYFGAHVVCVSQTGFFYLRQQLTMTLIVRSFMGEAWVGTRSIPLATATSSLLGEDFFVRIRAEDSSLVKGKLWLASNPEPIDWMTIEPGGGQSNLDESELSQVGMLHQPISAGDLTLVRSFGINEGYPGSPLIDRFDRVTEPSPSSTRGWGTGPLGAWGIDAAGAVASGAFDSYVDGDSARLTEFDRMATIGMATETPVIVTDLTWVGTRTPVGSWKLPGYDDSGWVPVSLSGACSGVPIPGAVAIQIQSSQQPDEEMYYRKTFTLGSGDLGGASDAVLVWASDNGGEVFLNGTEIASLGVRFNHIPATYSSPHYATFDRSLFVAGENVIAIVNFNENPNPGPIGTKAEIRLPGRCSGGNLGPDPQEGFVCENLTQYFPPGGTVGSTYWRTSSYFVEGSTRLHVDGLFIRPVDYDESGNGKRIEIFSSVPTSVLEGSADSGHVVSKVVYMCYWSTPNIIPNSALEE